MLAALKKGSASSAGFVTRALDTSTKKIELEAKKEAPVNKSPGITGGNLRQSIRSSMLSAFKGQVEVGVKYAAAVHDGTRPHQIRAINRRVLADKRTGRFFGVVVNHPGTRANPFLQRAVDGSGSFIREQFDKALSAIISAASF